MGCMSHRKAKLNFGEPEVAPRVLKLRRANT